MTSLKTPLTSNRSMSEVAEGARFELANACASAVFKTAGAGDSSLVHVHSGEPSGGSSSPLAGSSMSTLMSEVRHAD